MMPGPCALWLHRRGVVSCSLVGWIGVDALRTDFLFSPTSDPHDMSNAFRNPFLLKWVGSSRKVFGGVRCKA